MSNVSSSNGLEKCPKLRFPGFDEPWNETALEDLGNFYNGLSGKDKSDFGKGADCYITYMNVYKNVIADVNGCDVVSIEEGEHQNRVNFGDLLFTQSSETLEEVGLTSVWLNDDTPLLNSFCFGFHFDSSSLINPRFAAYSMRTPYARKRITREGQGATRYNLSSNRLKKVKILYPSHSEQDKIAGLLSLLETRIEKQCGIIDQLKKYKRGVLSKLLGEKVTQGCTTKSYYFSEIAQRRSEKYDPTSGIEYPCVELENIEQETGKILSTVPSTAQSSIKNIAKSGDTLFGKLRPYLRKYAFAQKTMACSSEIWALIPSDAVLPKFLFYLVQTEQFLRVANISSGTKMPRAEWSNIEKTEFFIPDPFVQRKVVSLLEGLDQKITFADSALFSLNRLKASLMQQLFI